MFEIKANNFKDTISRYNFINFELEKLIQSEPDSLANLSNAAALLWEYIENINWSGFYLMRNDELVLGPFQGKPACVHIALGSGVCGTAAETKLSQVVHNVHLFPGHIACDSQSNSEVVVPILDNDKVVAVIDVDSPNFSNFDDDDRVGLEMIAATLNKYIRWSEL